MPTKSRQTIAVCILRDEYRIRQVTRVRAETLEELAGGLFYFNYPGGTGLMSGSVFGRIAGSFAAEFRHDRVVG